MNSEFYEEVPVLSREEAIAILNTPNNELNTLIDRAKNLRYNHDRTDGSRYLYSCPTIYSNRSSSDFIH